MNITKTRVHVENVVYKVNEEKGVVVALLEWRPIIDDNLVYLNPFVFNNFLYANDRMTKTSKGVANLRPGDKFDLEKGKRIALARAEVAAYNRLTKLIQAARVELQRLYSEATRFILLSKKVREGNKKYIIRVDNGEV